MQLLFIHSQLQDLQLKNFAIYPSDYSILSDTTIYWANINFQPIGDRANEYG
jgi:hypothetical protein